MRAAGRAMVDCVISNGVINLAPDKQGVFGAAAEAVRPGGRLVIADIVTAVRLPNGITCDASLWAARIGAAQRDDYLGCITAAGFAIETVRENDYRFVSERAVGAKAPTA
jgi:arsenite methyltransferase